MGTELLNSLLMLWNMSAWSQLVPKYTYTCENSDRPEYLCGWVSLCGIWVCVGVDVDLWFPGAVGGGVEGACGVRRRRSWGHAGDAGRSSISRAGRSYLVSGRHQPSISHSISHLPARPGAHLPWMPIRMNRARDQHTHTDIHAIWCYPLTGHTHTLAENRQIQNMLQVRWR